MEVELSIVVVQYNTKLILKNCIESILNNLNKIIYEVIIIDNSSTDGSVEMLEKEYKFENIHILKNKSNAGFAKGVNQGVLLSKGSNIMILNPDTLILDNVIRKMLDYLNQNKDVSVIGPKLLDQNSNLFFSCRKFSNYSNQIYPFIPFFNRNIPQVFQADITDKEFYSRINEVDYMWGACLIFRRDIFDKLDGFDERFFLYSEEEDFCYRIRKLGKKCIFYPYSEVVHIGKASSSGVFEKAFKQLYYSKLLYFRKNHSFIYSEFFKVSMIILVVIQMLLYSVLRICIPKRSREFKEIIEKRRLILNAYVSDKEIFK